MSDRRRNSLLIAGLLLVSLLPSADALAQSVFGKNKVVYVDRDWRVFKQDKINLYFYAKEEEMARYSLAIALEAYAEFSEYFDFEFKSTIPITCFSNSLPGPVRGRRSSQPGLAVRRT